MITKKVPKLLLSSVLSTFLLAGFSGKEKYVELTGFLNGRENANFSGNANIVSVLRKGTQGEIIARATLPSGNIGYQILVTEGPATGKFWVYHNIKNSDLKLYEQKPTKQNPAPKETTATATARAVETVRDTAAVPSNKNTSAPKAAEKKTELVKPNDSRAVVEAINKTNDRVGAVGTLCTDCLAPRAGKDSLLAAPGSRRQSQACSSFMNSQGEIGPDGQTVFNLMASEPYAKLFTAKNALGNFCPKFNTLNDTQKLQAWTWFWTSLAMEESSCDPQRIHGTTYKDRNGKIRILNPTEGYGLWAMERDRNRRAWRGDACTNISTVYGQAKCSIDIMAKTQLERGRTAKVSSGGYWGPVHRGDSQLMPHMKRMRQCF
ncbi:MAG: hypothetical protein HUU57_11190 [Bdellovibrio sp.]|nr:hypothetical protein [Bdellovibrio sp.]